MFGIGPAGTGKTYLAMAKAVQALQAKQVNRIILTRPAVEAGERLGFLPGTLFEKIDPYLRPLYDALHDMLDPESIPKLMAAGTIEVAPLAYMRGRAQPVDTPVLTPEGFRPIGELEVGDLVVGSDGLPTPVLGVHPQGAQGGLPRLDAGRCVDAGVRGAPVVGPDPRTTAAAASRLACWRRGSMSDCCAQRTRAATSCPSSRRWSSPADDVPLDPYALGPAAR